eukprot:1382351-Prymnesium_polylepis.1
MSSASRGLKSTFQLRALRTGYRYDRPGEDTGPRTHSPSRPTRSYHTHNSKAFIAYAAEA